MTVYTKFFTPSQIYSLAFIRKETQIPFPFP